MTANKSAVPFLDTLISRADKRQIPLNKELTTEKDFAPKLHDSFALALAKAIRGDDSIFSELNLPIYAQVENVLADFLPEEKYQPISALTLDNAGLSGLPDCRDKVLLIGGHWHDLQGYGGLVDNHLSPVGALSGLGLHANYLASLLERQYAHELPLWINILLDLVIGLGIYTCFEIARDWRALLVLFLAFLLPILCAYVSLVTANLYLDFLLPLELYFVHICYEMSQDYVVERWLHRASLSSP